MRKFEPERRGQNVKRFCILALTILVSFGAFGFAIYGVMYATMGALVGAIAIGLMPFAGHQISEKMDESSRMGDLMVVAGIIGGVVFLVLFFVLRRRLK